jgi:hypothetical protein
MHLTRRADLRVSEQSGDEGLDLLAEILKGGRQTGRLFGVQVKGIATAPRAAGNGTRRPVRVPLRPEPWVTSIPFPVCLFVSTMDDDDRGYFRWVKEPVAPRRLGDVSLRPTADEALLELTDDSIADIVRRVGAWYDERNAASVA